jgi:hypothetical protein
VKSFNSLDEVVKLLDTIIITAAFYPPKEKHNNPPFLSNIKNVEVVYLPQIDEPFRLAQIKQVVEGTKYATSEKIESFYVISYEKVFKVEFYDTKIESLDVQIPDELILQESLLD